LPLLATATARSADLDSAALDRGGEIAYRRALAPAASERRLDADAATAARARRVLNQLAIAAPAIDPMAKRFAWAIHVVPGAGPDARAFPGGRVLVSDTLFAQTAFTNDEAAAIIAHALAHSMLGHDVARIARRVGSQPVSPDPNRQALDVAEAVAGVLAAPGYSRAEIEAADRTSVELLAHAGFDPRAAGSAWRRLALGNRGIVERAAIGGERLAALDAAIRAAVLAYERTRAKAAADATQVWQPPVTGAPKAQSPVPR
jgi:Zn-dependent protease with chaperone function